MRRQSNALVVAMLLGLAVSSSTAQGGSTTAGNKGEADDLSSAAATPLTLPAAVAAKSLLPIQPSFSSTATPGGTASLEAAMVTVTLNRDGSVAETPPSDAMQSLIEAQTSSLAQSRAGRAVRAVRGTATQVTNVSDYPARAVGWLLVEDQRDQWGSCTASLVGPRTVITAAHCVYDAQTGGWAKTVSFSPGVVDGKTAPFGQFDWDTIRVPKGFIDSHDTRNAGPVLPWDIAVITLQQDAGTQVGWLGFAVDDASPFNATVLGYPSDKPAGSLWTIACAIGADGFMGSLLHTGCDATAGASGAPVVQDIGAGDLYIRGLTVAAAGGEHYGVRLTGTTYQFILDHYL